jgi:hypothetical protein
VAAVALEIRDRGDDKGVKFPDFSLRHFKIQRRATAWLDFAAADPLRGNKVRVERNYRAATRGRRGRRRWKRVWRRGCSGGR